MPPREKKGRLQVTKTYLDYTPVIHPPNFPSMPRMYLELLENKKKIRPELRNVEYIPKETSQTPSLAEANNTATAAPDPSFKLEDDIKSPNPSKRKTATAVLDLGKMSEEDIKKMVDERKKSNAPEFSLSREEKGKILEGGFPQPGPALDSKYQKMRNKHSVIIPGSIEDTGGTDPSKSIGSNKRLETIPEAGVRSHRSKDEIASKTLSKHSSPESKRDIRSPSNYEESSGSSDKYSSSSRDYSREDRGSSKY